MKSSNRNFLLATVAVTAIFGGLSMGNALIGKGASGGAIFTTDVSGTVTNENLYASKGDVFLNGGPQSGNCAAAGLPDGDYVFQVTDPSGKTLLSSDDIVQRKFAVTDGVTSAYLGNTHVTSTGPCSGRTIGLAPFNTTTNAGGEYKVWVTPASSYSPSQGTFGFKNNDSKTDNFKIRAGAVEVGATIFGRTYQDLNANGTDDGELGLGNLTMTLKTTGGTVIGTAVTDAGGYYTLTGVPAGTYDLCQAQPTDGRRWILTEPTGSTGGCTRITVTSGATLSRNFGNYPTDVE